MDSRRGLDLWGPVGRWAFLNWPRGSWQYDLICGAIIVGLFVLPSPPPQTLDVDGVLGAVEAADTEMESFTADMVATEHVVLFDERTTEVGTVAFLKPAYFRREVTEPSPEIIAVGDGELTMYLPRINQATIMNVGGEEDPAEGFAFPGLASASELKDAYDISLEGTETSEEDGATLYILRLVPKSGNRLGRSYRTITMSVADGEWHPARRIVLESHVGDTTTVVISNVVRDADLEPEYFEIDLPEGTEIVRRGETDAP